MQTFKNEVYLKYQVQAKISGLIEHPIIDRIKLLKKVKMQAGPTHVIAYDLKEGLWSEIFQLFSTALKSQNIELKLPADKTPHVTLAYLINATPEEVEKAKKIAAAITPLTVAGVTLLKGKVVKETFVVLDFDVTTAFRTAYNAIAGMVGRDRIVDYRTIWQGHIPHASIGTIAGQIKDADMIKKKLTSLVKGKKLTFMPKFVEVHLNTKVGAPFNPEMVDYTEIEAQKSLPFRY